jgi:hypothetical protein
MRLLTLSLAILAFFCPADSPAGSLKDQGFAAPRGEFTVARGTFSVPKDTFVPTPGTFTVVPGTFSPSKDFPVAPGTFTGPKQQYVPQAGQYSTSGESRVKPGAYSISNGFLTRK